MKILAIDDERTSLNILARAIREAMPDAELSAFQSVSDALFELREKGYRPDVAFLDIEMPVMTGLEFTLLMKERVPEVNVVFVTSHSQYALKALALRPSGYMMKPVDQAQIMAEMNNLRYPPARTLPPKRVRVQCFGNFEVFADGKPVLFPRAKSKELLAYLIDRRGSSCTADKIAEALWEDGRYDRARQKQLSTIRADMVTALKAVDAEAIIKKYPNAVAVDPSAFDCDYYMALSGDTVAINGFLGEYMAAYSWAEFTAAALTQKFSF